MRWRVPQPDYIGAAPSGAVYAECGARPLGEPRMRRVNDRFVAHPGLGRAPIHRLGHRAVTDQGGEVGDRQRLLDAQVVQHRPRRRGQLGDELVDVSWPGHPAVRLDVDSV